MEAEVWRRWTIEKDKGCCAREFQLVWGLVGGTCNPEVDPNGRKKNPAIDTCDRNMTKVKKKQHECIAGSKNAPVTPNWSILSLNFKHKFFKIRA